MEVHHREIVPKKSIPVATILTLRRPAANERFGGG
jgi:hypothetical protein